MLRNLLRDIYSNKKPSKLHLEATLVPLDSTHPNRNSSSNIDAKNSDLINEFGMGIVIDKELIYNGSENDQKCLFSALNPGSDVQFSEFSKNNVVSVYLKNTNSQSQSSSPLSTSQFKELIDQNSEVSNSINSIYQQSIYNKLETLRQIRESNQQFQKQQNLNQLANLNLPTHKTIIPSLFELIKNKPSLILHFKKEENSSQKQFYAIHINKGRLKNTIFDKINPQLIKQQCNEMRIEKQQNILFDQKQELFNVIEQNPLDFQTCVTVSSLKSSQINIKSSNYLKLIDFFLQAEIESLKSGQVSRRYSDKFDLHLISSQNKEIELEMQIFQYKDESNNQYFVFEGLKLKENCFQSNSSSSSSSSSSSLICRKDSNDICGYEPQLRKKKMNNKRKECNNNQNDEFNQKTLTLLEQHDHINDNAATRNSIENSYKQQQQLQQQQQPY